MDTAATRNKEYSVFDPVLYLAFELSEAHWKLGFTIGVGQRPRERNITACDLVALREEIRRAKKRFSLLGTAKVVSCYEAGRDGFPGLSVQDRLASSLSNPSRRREPDRRLIEHRSQPEAKASQDR